MEVLTDRLCDACGIKRKTPPVKERIEYLIKLLKYPVTMQNITLNKAHDYDRRFIWKDQTAPWKIMSTFRTAEEGDKPREPEEVPMEEAACAAIWLARTQFGMPRESLIYETGKALGFKTSTPTVKLMSDNAIDYAAGLGELTITDHMVK